MNWLWQLEHFCAVAGRHCMIGWVVDRLINVAHRCVAEKEIRAGWVHAAKRNRPIPANRFSLTIVVGYAQLQVLLVLIVDGMSRRSERLVGEVLIDAPVPDDLTQCKRIRRL